MNIDIITIEQEERLLKSSTNEKQAVNFESEEKPNKKSKLFMEEEIFKPRRKSNRKRKAVAKLNFTKFELMKNNDYCESCNGSGTFLCCDNCPRSFHFSCLNPPVDPNNIPTDDWFCKACRPTQTPKTFNKKGLFGNLIDVINKQNPQSFCLTDEIKNAFEGVGTNEYGEYVNTEVLKNPKQRNPYLGSDLRPLTNLKDNNDQIKICYRCKCSALSGPIIKCDYCSLNWHMDCLNPPLSVPPPQHMKWKCPNHVDHLLPKERKRKMNSLKVAQEEELGPNYFKGPSGEIFDESTIFSNFFSKVSQQKKLKRFNGIQKLMEQEMISSLVQPRLIAQNQLNIIQSLPSLVPKTLNSTESSIFKSSSSDSTSISASAKREKVGELIKVALGESKEPEVFDSIPGFPGVSPSSLNCSSIKISRPLFRQLNAVRLLMRSVDRKKLLDLLVNEVEEKAS